MITLRSFLFLCDLKVRLCKQICLVAFLVEETQTHTQNREKITLKHTYVQKHTHIYIRMYT